MTKLAVFTGLVLVVLGAAADLTGNWEVDASFDDGGLSGGGFDCAFKQDGEQLTGNCSAGTAQVTGEVKGRSISWHLTGADPSAAMPTFSGTVDDAGNSMKGRFTIAGKGGSFTAVRQ